VRVLTVSNLYPPQHLGGYELMHRAVVDGLRAAGHSAGVLTTDTRVRDEVAADEPHVARELRWYWREHRWPRYAPWTVRAIERHNAAAFARAAAGVDLVSFWAMGGMSMALLGMSRVPSLAVVHDAWPDYGPRVDRSWRGPVELPPAVWVSAFTRGGRAGEVVSSGYDERVFAEAPPRPEWRGRLLLPGRLDRRKGHLVALRALGPHGFAVAGAGDPALERELRRAGVALLGALDPPQLAREMAEADAVLFPVEWQEPWGLVALEAMAVGRPVIATGTGGSAEYLRDGVNALLVAPGDAAALRAAVERLREDPGLRARLREGGLATAREHTLSRFVTRMVAVHEAYAERR
jgi:glycosyltransferase involved in cell wall biosynthesis